MNALPSETSSDPVDHHTRSPLSQFSAKKLLWPLLLSLITFVVIAWITYEPDMFGQMWAKLNPAFLLAAVGMVGARMFFGGLRLYLMSHKHLPLWSAIRGQIAWAFASNVTPSAVGGAPIAAMFVARDSQMQVGETTAVMLFSMVLDQIFLATIVPFLMVSALYVNIYPAALGGLGAKIITIYLASMLVWIGLLVYATLVRPRVLEKIIQKLFTLPGLRRFKGYVQQEMKTLQERAALLRQESPLFFLAGYLLTALLWICRFSVLLFVIWSVYDALPVLTVFARTVGMMLNALLIPTPGGSGGVEGLYALYIAPLIPSALVAPTLLTWRLLNYYVFVAAGLTLFARHVTQYVQDKNETSGSPTDTPEEPSKKTVAASAEDITFTP